MIADTIAAITTPLGQGGIGVVRVSGPSAIHIGETIGNAKLVARRLTRATFADSQGEALDDGLAVAFVAPASYTGEDVVELQAHGSPVVLSILLERCLELGARMARPGEFSERAFLNGKLDLIQAEAVADLIASGSKSMARAAVRSLKGEFSRRVTALDDAIKAIRMEIEASIDFADEAEAFLDADDIAARLTALEEQARAVINEATRGAALSKGLKLVLAGAPNVGKSSLLNRLAGLERAIVSSEPGTTRDVLNEQILMAGQQVEVVDTAGLRPTSSEVEAEGVKRARGVIAEADVRIDLWDGSRPRTRDVWPPAESGQIVIEVMNKQDLLAGETIRGATGLAISAKKGTGCEALVKEIERQVIAARGEPAFLARARHTEALKRCEEALRLARREHETSKALELVAEALREAHTALGEIVGLTTTEDLLSEIFRNFCLGK